jgi:hypothetical protein
VNHLFLDIHGGGGRLPSAPPTSTPRADAARKEQARQAIFKDAAPVVQLPALAGTKRAGTSKRPLENEPGNSTTEHQAKKARIVQTFATWSTEAAQQSPYALPVQRQFLEVSTSFLLSSASHLHRTPWLLNALPRYAGLPVPMCLH